MTFFTKKKITDLEVEGETKFPLSHGGSQLCTHITHLILVLLN